VTQAVLPDGQEFGGEYFMFSRRSSDQPWQSASAGSDNPTSVRCRLPEELLREWHGEQVAENCAQLKNDSGR
jgi:hypothetical protein